MTRPTILSIDQGTTSTRAILFCPDGKAIGSHQIPLQQSFPQKSWVEQDPNHIWADAKAAVQAVLKAHPEDSQSIAGLGITNQRETTILWDRQTGEPVYPAIVWQDRRTSEWCHELEKKGYGDFVHKKTGLLINPYFSASKIRWILDHQPDLQSRAAKGELAFGTVDSYLIWKLTNGKSHVTDVTNAARTLLCDIHTMDWDQELLDLFGVPRALLPEIKPNTAEFGSCDKSHFGRELPIRGVAGDQHAALFGQACYDTGMVKSTFGTGCFALMNTGAQPHFSQHKLLTTPAWKIGDQKTYASEGAIFIAGAALTWIRDNLGMLGEVKDSEAIAFSVSDNGGVYFIPAFAGLGAPYWDPDVNAAIVGLTSDSKSAHIIRAALEAQAYQTKDLITAMEADTGHSLKGLRIDGGLANNKFMCQFLADTLNESVDVPMTTETTALGAAFFAGLQAGVYTDLEELRHIWKSDIHFHPTMTEPQRRSAYKGWQIGLQQVLAGKTLTNIS